MGLNPGCMTQQMMYERKGDNAADYGLLVLSLYVYISFRPRRGVDLISQMLAARDERPKESPAAAASDD